MSADNGRQQPTDSDMLFTDGLPKIDENVGYRGVEAARVAGISYRQLDYWARTGLVVPTVRSATGSGSQRLYSYQDIVLLKTVKRFLGLGVSLQQVRVAIDQLRDLGISDLSEITLLSDGASVYLCTEDDQILDLVKRGQGAFGLAIGEVRREVESELVKLESIAGDDPVDELARRRAARAAS